MSFPINGQVVIIDDEIASGKVTIAEGIHRIRVHRDNWFKVTASLSSLVELIDADKPSHAHQF